MAQRDDLVLVTGATGAQGGATARALLAAAFPVRVLSRNPGGDAAQALAQLGAEVVQGDYEDVPSIESACRDTAAVFSVQRPDTDGSDAERRHGFALIDAARKAGTRHFVHTSVCEAGKHESFPRWESGYWYQKYWTDKWDIEERVRAAGFERWTVLKPAFMMDNYAEPKAERMFPQLRHGEILTAFPPDTRLQLIAADDVGAFARAALMEPARFDRHDIDLAAEALTMTEVAAILSRHCGTTVRARSATAKEVKAAGQFPGWVRTQEWIGEVGYRADIGALTQWGVALTSFDSWVQRHRSSIRIDDGSRN